jgi:hypothetical protein
MVPLMGLAEKLPTFYWPEISHMLGFEKGKMDIAICLAGIIFIPWK